MLTIPCGKGQERFGISCSIYRQRQQVQKSKVFQTNKQPSQEIAQWKGPRLACSRDSSQVFPREPSAGKKVLLHGQFLHDYRQTDIAMLIANFPLASETSNS